MITNSPEWFKWILAHSESILTAIGTCLLWILGLLASQRWKVIYKQPKKEGFADFKESGAPTYYKDGPKGASGKGQHKVLKDGIIEISRSNTEGRWILQFLIFRSDDGQSLSYIPAHPESGSQRLFEVSLEARGIGGSHQLRVAFRTYPNEEFLQDAIMSVEPNRWQKFGRLMTPPANKDMFFFLESPAQAVMSSVQVRSLVLREKSSDLRFASLIRFLRLLVRRDHDQA